MPSPPEAETMTVSLAPFGMPGRYERLVVVPSPDGDYIVACLPFFSYGILFGDLVKVKRRGNAFERVLKYSGLRTLRLAFNDPARGVEAHEELHGKVIATRLAHEWLGAGYLAVLLRDRRDQKPALACLAGLEDDGSWEVDPEPFA